MYNVTIQRSVDAGVWNSLVRSVPEGTVFQTTYWADYVGSTGYCTPYFCSVKDGDAYKAVLLFWVEGVNARVRPENKIVGMLGAIAQRMRLSYGYWFYGPLVLDRADAANVLAELLDEVDRFCRTNKLVTMRNIAEPIHDPAAYAGDHASAVYNARAFTRIERATLFMDLRTDVDTAWSRLKKSTRKDVSSCEKHSLTAGLLSADELDEYRAVISENVRRVRADFPPYYPDINMWNALRGAENCLEVMAIKKDGRIMAGAGILDFNGILCHMTSCQTDESYFKKINVNDLLTWEIAKWGISRKRRLYDLTGIPLRPKDRKEQGLRNFKMKWSENIRVYNAYDKVYRSSMRALIRTVRRFL
ncbi:MAG TPA: GNAT family N-acetyltransferase [Candidatus Omnitrophota bacterium]|nr:GNAT family N-acetyltransferase [Candidatus Omnitrophota bacterium]